jgi:hypothetical protein
MQPTHKISTTTVSLRVVLSLTTRWRRRNLIRSAVAAFIIPAADLLLLTAVVVERRCALAPLPLAVDDRSNVQQAHNCSDNRVRNDRAPLSVSQLQTKPAVDHSENDGDATNADVCKGCGRTASVLLESTVVQPTAERLGEEDDEQHDTDDWVRVGEVSAVHSNPDADAECDDVDEEADDLQSSMNPDKAGEACDSDENSTDGEEGEESERGHDGVCCEHSLARGAEGAVTVVLRELRTAGAV